MRVDLQRNLLGLGGEKAPPAAVAPPRHTPDGATSEEPTEDETRQTAGGRADPTREAVVEPNVLDIDFERLAAEEDDDELRALHEYFAAREPTAQNEHTGRFEDYNLVFITAEGFSHLAVDPEVTPTLHKLTQEGFRFTDFDTPIWGVSTSDGEYVATTGLIPKSGVWSMYQSGDNVMPFAMGNQLGRLGYATFAYHNHTYDYYRRDVSHPNLGYDHRLRMGRDVFSDADPLVIFSDRSFLTDKGRYDAVAQEFTPADWVEVPEGYRQGSPTRSTGGSTTRR